MCNNSRVAGLFRRDNPVHERTGEADGCGGMFPLPAPPVPYRHEIAIVHVALHWVLAHSLVVVDARDGGGS